MQALKPVWVSALAAALIVMTVNKPLQLSKLILVFVLEIFQKVPLRELVNTSRFPDMSLKLLKRVPQITAFIEKAFHGASFYFLAPEYEIYTFPFGA